MLDDKDSFQKDLSHYPHLYAVVVSCYHIRSAGRSYFKVGCENLKRYLIVSDIVIDSQIEECLREA